ncbi:MAG: hypothetical protein ACK50Y_02340 [Flavobacteriia bacterium]|jgi:ABC-type Fe3+-siderophore transport system permease subunit
MNLYPANRIAINSKLSTEEIQQRLSSRIDSSEGIFNISNASRPFKGKIFENSFEIYHVINRKNSFIPIVKGEISTVENHSRIALTMKLSLISLFLLVSFSLYLLFLIFQTLFTNPAKSNNFSGMIMVILFTTAYALILNAFNKECRFAENYLSELFEAKN